MRRHIVLLLLLFVSMPLFGQVPVPGIGYVPPELSAHGLAAYNEHLAVIESNCPDIGTAVNLRDALARNGALVSIITSPRRMLAWVPPAARAAVASTRLETAVGSISVRSISYSSAEFAMQRTPLSILEEETEADRAIVAYLDHVRNLTPPDPELVAEEERRHERMLAEHGGRACLIEEGVDPTYEGDFGYTGLPAIRLDEDRVHHATALKGLVVQSTFFVESLGTTGAWDWDHNVYLRYRDLTISAINYWTTFAARYGKTITTLWLVYAPTDYRTQVIGEPVKIGVDAFVPLVILQLGAFPLGNDKPSDDKSLTEARRWCEWYNRRTRTNFGADDAICGFIAYKPSKDSAGGLWPRALIITQNGQRDGVFFQMDTQYSGSNPEGKPMRNVIAHELGHLWGAPDEYKTDNCNWTYRGVANLNCQTVRPAFGRAGFNMTGGEGIMRNNYLGGNSIATPVHTGVISAAEMVPVRLFHSSPDGIPLILVSCDRTGGDTITTPIGVPMDFDFCHRVVAPARVFIADSLRYFDYWEVTDANGVTRTLARQGLELNPESYSSTLENPITDVRAVYTANPPDIFTTNVTLEAHLAPADASQRPSEAIALKWLNHYDMSDARTIIEYEMYSGNWRELNELHYTIAPYDVPIGRWTGVHIHAIPELGSATRTVPIRAQQRYRFRIVGEFNGIRGTPSRVAEVTMRPSIPSSAKYCYDGNGPSWVTSPKLLPPSSPGMESYTIDAAIPITPKTGTGEYYVPAADFYRIVVSGVDEFGFGARHTFTLRVKEESNFKPRLRARPSGSIIDIMPTIVGDSLVLHLTRNGEYVVMVDAEISESFSRDYVDKTGGHFGFGEYEMVVERTRVLNEILCEQCVTLRIRGPIPGEIVMRPHPAYDLFRNGVDPVLLATFNMYYQTPPGYNFLGFGGTFGNLQSNPAVLNLGPTTPVGVYELYPMIQPIHASMAELVVIHPEGPEGVIESRVTRPVGEVALAQAKPPAGWSFIGWSGDTTGTDNPISVPLWTSKRLIALYAPSPCVPEPMSAWNHALNLRNARQGEVVLEYGMATGAADGLEAGQTDLPPIPPPSAPDIRWINITGSQGSTTDLRAIKNGHTFQGRVQTGGAAPVRMTWDLPAASPAVDYILKIQGRPGTIDLRAVSEVEFADEGTYVFSVEVKERICPVPTKENELEVSVVSVARTAWPCVTVSLQLRDRSSRELRPYANPYSLRFGEKEESGTVTPMRLLEFTQMDSVLHVRLCGREGTPPTLREREIVIISEPDDREQRRDTSIVRIPPPLPDGSGEAERFVLDGDGDWQMVSTPLLLKESRTAQLLGPADQLYGFNTGEGRYVFAGELEFGRGYWMKSTASDITLVGLATPSYEWRDLNGLGEPGGYGWNMIGSMARPVAVSAISQTPTGGLKALFGWDASVGYFEPSSILPGKGYWVRVEPGTRLGMSINSASGGRGEETTYRKAVNALDLVAAMRIVNEEGDARSLSVAGSGADPDERARLALPATPPAGLLDVRTDDGSAFLFPGHNRVWLRGQGRLTITMPGVSAGVRVEVRDEEERLLHVFDGERGDGLEVDANTALSMHVSAVPTVRTLALGGNYPNPVRIDARTIIPYTIDRESVIRLAVYDMLGRRLRTLAEGTQPSGSRLATWDGRDDVGNTLPAGIYTIRLESAGRSLARTMTIVR
ncbi:MAG: T9SS type A sorting domain-containing protein [Bacteroidetes bacterium]|nr:T9SS type A sorting domain-containing protein [Bacteroidota bacterium]